VGAAFKPPDVGLYPELAALTGGSRNFGRLVLWPDDIGDTPAGAVPGHELPSLARKLGKKARREARQRSSANEYSERNAMIFWRFVGVVLACALLLLVPARAQERTQQPGAQSPGRDVVMSKCFQCHTDAMFRDQRQDRRGWEAAIHRMIGRGGLWTVDEIKLMADYLGSEFGPKASTQMPPTQTPAAQTR
jgi:mono/diheme cytochrome c family protein